MDSAGTLPLGHDEDRKLAFGRFCLHPLHRDSRWDMFKEESELTRTNQQSDMSDLFLVAMTTFLELGCVSLIHG